MNHDNKIKVFFEGVEQASDTLDLDLINAQFADHFIFADPNGTRVVEKEKFLPFLPKRREFFRRVVQHTVHDRRQSHGAQRQMSTVPKRSRRLLKQLQQLLLR